MSEEEIITEDQSIGTHLAQVKHSAADEMQDREWQQHPGGG